MLIKQMIEEHLAVIEELKKTSIDQICQFGNYCCQALSNGHTIYFMGNGGSAADSQHLAAELVGRFQRERRGLPSVAFTTDTSILTAVANDFGFEQIFVRQVQALVKAGDILVGISASGNSPNVLMAMELGKEYGAITIGLTGRSGGKLANVTDLCIKVPSDITARIQEAHIMIGHIVCGMIDEATEHVSE